MQFRKFFTLALFPVLVLTSIEAQELRTNAQGEKIIVYPDGRWEYFSKYGRSSEGNATPTGDPNNSGSSSNNRYPIFEGDISAMNQEFVLNEEGARMIANRRYQLAKEAAIIADLRAKEATLQKTVLEKELSNAKMSIPKDQAQINRLQIRLTAARKTENETAQELDQAQLAVLQAKDQTESGKYLALLNTTRSTSKAPISTFSENSGSFDYLIDLDKNFNRAYQPDKNLAKAAALKNCEVDYSGKDQNTGQPRRDLAQQVLFTHTDEKLRVFLRDKPFLTCEGHLTALGGFKFLSLTFTFSNPNAQETYGSLDKGSYLTIKLINEDFISLRANKTDRGKYNVAEETVTYKVNYTIDQSQVNIIKNSEVDKVMVFWSTGYEEYEVYEVGFFMDQIRCLE